MCFAKYLNNRTLVDILLKHNHSSEKAHTILKRQPVFNVPIYFEGYPQNIKHASLFSHINHQRVYHLNAPFCIRGIYWDHVSK